MPDYDDVERELAQLRQQLKKFRIIGSASHGSFEHGFVIGGEGGGGGGGGGGGTSDFGACCFINSCAITLEADCDGVTGFFQGVGSTCGVDCVMGACCVDSSCYEDETKGYCEACCPVGVHHPGEICADQLGACCNKADQTCEDDVSPGDCAVRNGIFLGPCCTCAGCGPCPGACCSPNGAVCTMVNGAESCLGGNIWKGGDCAGAIPPCDYCCALVTVTLSVDVDITQGSMHITGSGGLSGSVAFSGSTVINDSFHLTVVCDPDCDEALGNCSKTADLDINVVLGCGPLGLNFFIGSAATANLTCNGADFVDWSGIAIDQFAEPPIPCDSIAGTYTYTLDPITYFGLTTGSIVFTLVIS